MFVDRSIQNGEEIVTLRYAAAFYWLMWPTLAITWLTTFVSSLPVYIATAVAWILLLIVAIPYWPVVATLKKQMRDATITASGSKYSFSNPLTYRWPVDDRNVES